MTHGLAAQERALMGGEQVAAHSLASLHGWYPVTVGESTLGWRELGLKRFTEPFFSDTLTTVTRRSCSTPHAALAQFDDTVAPSAFIFHVSRCGSTLLTQALAALAHCVVLSEPPVLDAFLREHGADDRAAIALLRGLVGALGQRRAATDSALVIKLDCWHIHRLATIRRAFPAVPCLFLYREPGAVLASHQRRRGPQMVPGMIAPERLQITPGRVAAADLDGYCALVLERLYASALAQADGLILLNYQQLPDVIAPALLARLAIACSARQRAAIAARAGFHSKEGGVRFAGDPPGGRPAPGAALAAAYAQLEQLRLAADKEVPHAS